MALPRWWMKYMSPISAGATESAAPLPADCSTLAAMSEPNDGATAHQTEHSVMSSVATINTGRRPAQLDSGTHQMLDAPSIRLLTCERVSVSRRHDSSIVLHLLR